MVTSIIFSSMSSAVLPPSTLSHEELRSRIPKLPQKKTTVEGDAAPELETRPPRTGTHPIRSVDTASRAVT